MKVSVIIPLYNKEHFIQDTIHSVLAQSYSDWEAIIIDDGSTDGSAQMAQSVHDPRIRFYTQDNQGVSRTRNRGIKLASGEYIAFLDADDQWESNYLETMMELADRYADYSVFCSAQNGRPINALPPGVSIINDHCAYPYIFWTGCLLIKKNVFDRVGGFREGVQLGEDRDMWLRIACYYPAVYLNQELVFHPYVTENNLASTIDVKQSFPYWEWYAYPYPNRKSLYKYTTNLIVKCAEELIRKRRFSDAWYFLKRTKGCTSIRPRLRLLLKLLLRKT